MIEPLIEELELDHVGMLALEAAAELTDPRLIPALKVLEEEWQETKTVTRKNCKKLYSAARIQG